MLYVDSADRRPVEALLATGLFAGVTTNPAILHRAGLGLSDVAEVHRWATAAGAQKVFLQVCGVTAEEMVRQGRRLIALGENVVIKVPATATGLAAGRALADAGVPLLVTAVHHSSQALLASAVGASWIAPYVGRITELGRDGLAETLAAREVLRGTGSWCRVVAASLRDVEQVAALAVGGVEDFTLSVSLCEALLNQEDTARAAAEFEELAWADPAATP